MIRRLKNAWNALFADSDGFGLDVSAPKRLGAEVRRPHEAASITELNRNWQPGHHSGDSVLAESWDLTTSRVRDLIRNEPTLRRARNQIARLIIGTGILTFSNVESIDPEHNPKLEKYATESDAWFDHWAEKEADARGIMSWYEMQDQMIRDTAEAGTSLLLKCMRNEPGRSVPLCYQLIEFEQLDRTKDRAARAGENRISQGIEVDSLGRPVAYWIYDAHPYDFDSGGSSYKSTRIAAERVIPYYIPDRISAVCGISWFAPLVRPVKDMDWYVATELQAAAIGALLTLVYKSEDAQGLDGLDDGLGDTRDDNSNPLVKLGRAITAVIGTEEEISVAESKRPNRDAGPFLEVIQKLLAMGADLSYIRLTGDLKNTSYTAARAAHLDDQAMASPLQKSFSHRVVLPVRRAHNRMAAAARLYRSVTPREFERDEHTYQLMKAQPVGREQLDPIKETTAAAERLRTFQTTLEEEIGKRGGNWKQYLRQRRRENQYAEGLGLVLDYSKGNGGNPLDQQDDNESDTNQEDKNAAA